MDCTMLDALRHRIVQNIELLHVAAAPPLTIDLHAPAPHCIPAEQCQKNIDRTQKSPLKPAQLPAEEQFLVNFVQFLCNRLPIAFCKSSLPQPQKDLFQNCPVIAKNQCPHKKILHPNHLPSII